MCVRFFLPKRFHVPNFYLLVHYLFCPLDPHRLRHSQVIQLVPPDWPVSAMSSFLTRSFRRTLHASHEGQIIKAISSGQNLEVRLFHSGPAVCSSFVCSFNSLSIQFVFRHPYLVISRVCRVYLSIKPSIWRTAAAVVDLERN